MDRNQVPNSEDNYFIPKNRPDNRMEDNKQEHFAKFTEESVLNSLA